MSSVKRARRKPGENRRLLLEAGLTEFGLLGFARASTSRIAELAGVPQPHVYASFGSKRDLFLACVELVLDSYANVSATDSLNDERAYTHARFLLQLVAHAQDAELGIELRSRLLELRGAMGAEGFDSLILLGAASLLQQGQPKP